ncbi:hypothetical protein APHAL10511_000791 [Amanita phalloides]|nr:hypothetical protein APHAL10511_000791 [Amanita phalloides]
MARRFWKHAHYINLACTELKAAWEDRVRDSVRVITTDPHISQREYRTTFRGSSAIIDEIIFDDDHKEIGTFIEVLREQTYTAFGSERDSDGKVTFFHVSVTGGGQQSELNKWMCVQHWEVQHFD